MGDLATLIPLLSKFCYGDTIGTRGAIKGLLLKFGLPPACSEYPCMRCGPKVLIISRLRFVSTGPPGPCHYDFGVCFKLSLLLLHIIIIY